MNTLAKIETIPTPNLQRLCLMINGNSHRPDLLMNFFEHEDLLQEAMLPEIRTIATLIAAQRHDFSQPSPTHFTEEADWFAARILVLGVRFFSFGNLYVANFKISESACCGVCKTTWFSISGCPNSCQFTQ